MKKFYVTRTANFCLSMMGIVLLQNSMTVTV